METIYRFFEKWLGGHFSFFNITVHGFNAMHLAIQLHTRKWGYICFHPPLYWGRWNGWYLYVSPNATPWASTLAFGPGVERKDKMSAKLRRKKYGHNFNTDLISRCADGAWA